MLTFHPVNIKKDLDRTHPLFVGNFFKLEGMWWRKRKQRQGLIISIAMSWYRLVKNNKTSPGFIEAETLITNLTRQVKDARIILDHFFTVNRLGFNFSSSNKSPSSISPKRLGSKMLVAVESIFNEVHFSPGTPPSGKKYTQSSVSVQHSEAVFVLSELVKTGREDLIPPIAWLFNQNNPITFYFEPAGSLMARDKSVWPIKCIEMWPGWLRKRMFGTVIDIENSYVQFLVRKLELKYKDNLNLLELKYPDLLRADRDKQNFRDEICRDFLKLEINDDNLSVVKCLMMALANGSNATPALMTNGSGRSEAVKIIHAACPHLLPSDLIRIGSRLSVITKQFAAAKRALCLFLLNIKPTRENQKKIFKMYFEWERESRYAIWKLTNMTGLALHDGLDGIIVDNPSTFAEEVFKKTGLKTKVSYA